MKLVTLHPNYALFIQPYEAGTFACDLLRLGRMVRGELEPLPDAVAVNPDHHLLFELVREAMLSGEPVAVDIETAPCDNAEPWTGTQPTRALLKSIAFGTTKRALAYWWEDVDPATASCIAGILADPNVRKIFQNGAYFDLPVLARYGLKVVCWDDTRDMRRALSSTSRLSLRYQTSIYTDFPNWKDAGDDFEKTQALDESEAPTADEPEEVVGDAPQHSWQSRNKSELLHYNGMDTVATARVFRGLSRDKSRLPANESARVQGLYDLHVGLAALSAEMHQVGMFVRQDWRSFMIAACRQEVSERAATVSCLVDRKAFKPTANSMRSVIFKKHATDKLGRFYLDDPWDKKAYTKTGLCAVNERALLLLLVSGACPDDLVTIIEAWWEYQGALKRLGYLTSPMLDEATGPDGRVHAGFNSCGTDTGRPSCSEPNLLNVEHLLRHMFGPPPGSVYVHADKSQLELRVMECVAADDFLGAALQTGDVYSYAAREWFSLPPTCDVKKEYPGLRQANKIIQLARQYGAGQKTVFQQALKQNRKFTLSKVQTLIATWDKTNFRTKAYWTEELGRVMDCGYSESRICNRRRVYPQPPELTEVANYPVQSTASDLMNLEVLEVRRRLAHEVPNAKIVCYLYDAIDVECSETEEPKVRAIMNDVMNRSWTIDGRERPFPVEFKVATYEKTWAGAA